MIFKVVNGKAKVLADISVQADWEEKDKESKAYIKNKPSTAHVRLITNENDKNNLKEISKNGSGDIFYTVMWEN